MQIPCVLERAIKATGARPSLGNASAGSREASQLGLARAWSQARVCTSPPLPYALASHLQSSCKYLSPSVTGQPGFPDRRDELTAGATWLGKAAEVLFLRQSSSAAGRNTPQAFASRPS